MHLVVTANPDVFFKSDVPGLPDNLFVPAELLREKDDDEAILPGACGPGDDHSLRHRVALHLPGGTLLLSF